MAGATINSLIKYSGLALAISWLSACSHAPLKPTYHNMLPALRQTQLTAIQNWDIDGAFSLQGDGRAVVANYHWVQQDLRYELRIAATLNLYSVVVASDGQQVGLWRSNQLLGSAARAETLMQQQLGWQLPVSNLRYWIRSLPAPGPYHAEFDSWGHLISLKQQGWQIEYSNYINMGANDLPTTIRLYSSSWKAKILIKRWG